MLFAIQGGRAEKRGTMKFKMHLIEVAGRNAALVLNAKLPKGADQLDWYGSMLGRVLRGTEVEIDGSIVTRGRE